MTPAQAAASSDESLVGFETLQLQVGTRLQLNVTRDLKHIQLFSNVIGWVKNEYLLLQIPMEGAQPFPLREGDRLTVRVFSGVQVCWFHTTVLRTFMQPYRYMHVAFPREISGRQLRSALRVRVEVPATMKVQGLTSGLKAKMRNASVVGAALESAEGIPDEVDTIDLRFVLHPADGVPEMQVETKAVIRNRSFSVSNDPSHPFLYSYGVQFIELGATQKLALQNLIYATLMMDRQKMV